MPGPPFDRSPARYSRMNAKRAAIPPKRYDSAYFSSTAHEIAPPTEPATIQKVISPPKYARKPVCFIGGRCRISPAHFGQTIDAASMVQSNDLVQRAGTMNVPRQDAAHEV